MLVGLGMSQKQNGCLIQSTTCQTLVSPHKRTLQSFAIFEWALKVAGAASYAKDITCLPAWIFPGSCYSLLKYCMSCMNIPTPSVKRVGLNMLPAPPSHYPCSFNPFFLEIHVCLFVDSELVISQPICQGLHYRLGTLEWSPYDIKPIARLVK